MVTHRSVPERSNAVHGVAHSHASPQKLGIRHLFSRAHTAFQQKINPVVEGVIDGVRNVGRHLLESIVNKFVVKDQKTPEKYTGMENVALRKQIASLKRELSLLRSQRVITNPKPLVSARKYQLSSNYKHGIASQGRKLLETMNEITKVDYSTSSKQEDSYPGSESLACTRMDLRESPSSDILPVTSAAGSSAVDVARTLTSEDGPTKSDRVLKRRVSFGFDEIKEIDANINKTAEFSADVLGLVPSRSKKLPFCADDLLTAKLRSTSNEPPLKLTAERKEAELPKNQKVLPFTMSAIKKVKLRPRTEEQKLEGGHVLNRHNASAPLNNLQDALKVALTSKFSKAFPAISIAQSDESDEEWNL